MSKFYAEKISLPDCEFCSKVGKFKIIQDNITFFLCEKCFKEFKKREEISSSSNLETIPLQNRGLFKTSSSVFVGGGLSFERWKDFGLERKSFRKIQPRNKHGMRVIILSEITMALNEEKAVKEKIIRHSMGEKLILYRVKLESFTAYLNMRDELLFVEWKDSVDFF